MNFLCTVKVTLLIRKVPTSSLMSGLVLFNFSMRPYTYEDTTIVQCDYVLTYTFTFIPLTVYPELQSHWIKTSNQNYQNLKDLTKRNRDFNLLKDRTDQQSP